MVLEPSRTRARFAWVAVVLFAVALPARAWDGGRAGFGVRVKGEATAYSVLGVFVLPGEVLPIAVAPEDAGTGTYTLVSVAGAAAPDGIGWRWRAPAAPGLYPLRVVQHPSERTLTLNAFVMVPATRVAAGKINGYQVGEYPPRPFQGLASYLPPRGFVEVTAALQDVRVAPHFTLGQFVSRQAAPFPKYVALRERLLLKLELVLEAVNAAGHSADTLYVQSGYRTPFHNHERGQGVYSRHIYGDAADIFVDADGDGRMDDLDGDGRSDDGDARALAALVEGIDRRPALAAYTGGLGIYPGSAAFGPYLHVDARGTLARWQRPSVMPQVAQAQPPAAPAALEAAAKGAPR